MILIALDVGFKTTIDESIAALRKYHIVEIVSIAKVQHLAETIREDVYNSVFKYDEPEFIELRQALPRRKKFKLNCKELLDWQRKQRGFIRPAFGFSDSATARRVMKRAGFFVGKLDDIILLARKMEAA